MLTAICKIDLFLPYVQSLKDKREILKSLEEQDLAQIHEVVKDVVEF